MKILYVSQYFPPEMGAPAARVYEISRAWASMGHDVTVLTGFPNHPTGVIPPEYRGQYLRKETVDGIAVVRVPIYAAANKGFAKRVLNYLSFAASASVVGPVVTSRPDVLVATSPQFLCGVAGRLVAWGKRVPFVFEVRDLWPRSIVEVGAMKADSWAVKGMELMEKGLYRAADHIVAVTDSFVGEIAAKGVSSKKISVVTNGVDLDLFQPGDRSVARRLMGLPSDKFIATYVGTHGMAHGLDLVLDTALLMKDQPILFLLVGEGAEKAALKQRASVEGISNVVFWDQRPRDQVSQIIAASSVCLVMLRDKPLFRTVIPSKIFEFMGAARGILTTVDGESRGIVEAAGAGVFSPPGDATTLKESLLRLMSEGGLDAMGQAGRRFVESHYSRPVLAAKYADILAMVVASAT